MSRRKGEGTRGPRKRNRGQWTAARLAKLAVVNDVIEKHRDWWPLTLRFVYYQLVAAQVIPNKRSAYSALSALVTHARIDGRTPWEALEDRGRRTLFASGWSDSAHFQNDQAEDFLRGYRRDLQLRQPEALEVWIEKDALSEIAHRVALPYCVPVVVARGYSSAPYLNEFAKRVRRRADRGQRTRVLYFGDLDPSGWNMLPAMMTTLEQELGLAGLVSAVRCALTPEQVVERRLPYSFDALKAKDPRTPRYRQWLHDSGFDDSMAVELDALSPDVLSEMIESAIVSHVDLGQLERDMREEDHERQALLVVRDRALAAIGGAR
jgi:hypothetical protein